MDVKAFTLVVFSVTYLYLILFHRGKAVAIWIGILLILAFGNLELREIPYFINWNVIGIFAGTLVIAELFIHSRVPVLLSDILVSRSHTVGMAILWVCILSSFLSAFIENVATVLIVAPVALALARRLRVSPAPFLIGLAICSNLQGTATLIGDPPSMILAGYEKMSFNDFFFFKGNPGIFFAVEIGAIVSFIVLYFIFRKYREPVTKIPLERPTSWIPTTLLVGMIVALAASPLVDPDFDYLAGVICLLFGAAGLVWQFAREKGKGVETLKSYDWETTFFLAGIFVMVGSIEDVGLIEDLAHWITSVTGSSLFWNYTFIVWFSVLFSAFIDNVPYITAMIPVAHILAKEVGSSPYLLVFGLLIGSCLGGNITPIGAAANIVSVGILKRNGYKTSFLQFVRIGVPFTIAATAAGYAFLWWIWR